MGRHPHPRPRPSRRGNLWPGRQAMPRSDATDVSAGGKEGLIHARETWFCASQHSAWGPRSVFGRGPVRQHRRVARAQPSTRSPSAGCIPGPGPCLRRWGVSHPVSHRSSAFFSTWRGRGAGLLLTTWHHSVGGGGAGVVGDGSHTTHPPPLDPPHTRPPTPLKDWAKFSSGPSAGQQCSLAPSAPISLDQKMSSVPSAPLKTQHHQRG